MAEILSIQLISHFKHLVNDPLSSSCDCLSHQASGGFFTVVLIWGIQRAFLGNKFLEGGNIVTPATAVLFPGFDTVPANRV